MRSSVCASVCAGVGSPLYASAGIKTHQEAGGYWLGRVSLTPVFGRQAIYQPSITGRRPKLGTIKQPDFWCQCWGGSISAWHAISGKSKEGSIVRAGGETHKDTHIHEWATMCAHTCMHCALSLIEYLHYTISNCIYFVSLLNNSTCMNSESGFSFYKGSIFIEFTLKDLDNTCYMLIFSICPLFTV